MINELVRVGVSLGNVMTLVLYLVIILVALKIVETGLNIVHAVKGKKEKIVREIETIEKRKPVIKFKADSILAQPKS